MLHYLGPHVGKIPLTTWDEVVRAAEGGQLAETQWVELKKQLRPPGKEGNLELARDLASLSFEGGVLVIGVEDKTHEVVGCDVEGYRDRISQVASMTVHPSLTPVIYPAVAHPEDPSKGVLVVEVPPSALAPHMVDGSYWGRSSDGKRKLGDSEVRMRMEARTGSAAAFKERLLGMVEHDPVAPLIEGHPTGNGHIYLLAEPCAPVLGRSEELNLQNVVVGLFGQRDQMGTLSSLRYSARDPEGLAVVSPGSDTPAARKYEDDVCHLLLRDEDSSLQYVSGGGTMYRLMRRPDQEAQVEIVGATAVAQSTLQFFTLIQALSLDHWGYTGQWRVGVHVSNLAGKVISMNDIWRSGQTFSGKAFTNHLVTSPASWAEGPEPAARPLLTGFLRALGQDGRSLDQVRTT